MNRKASRRLYHWIQDIHWLENAIMNDIKYISGTCHIPRIRSWPSGHLKEGPIEDKRVTLDTPLGEDVLISRPRYGVLPHVQDEYFHDGAPNKCGG